MKNRRGWKIIRTVLFILTMVIVVLFSVRTIGRIYYASTPAGGINESMYVDVNGTKQWINIYGEDINNPVLLYLHGGPGSATSSIDYAFTRKWADVYTVVTWDQRNCGKSYDPAQNGIALTRAMLLTDGKELTEFLLNYLSKSKLTILGHSWGSIYGANLALEYPEYYDCFIGTGQLVDFMENEQAFKQEAAKWAVGDAQSMALVQKLTPGEFTTEYAAARNALMEKYGYSMMAGGSDYNLALTILFNPHYSIADWVNYFKVDMGVYMDFLNSREFRAFSLKGRTRYQMPYYNINGDRDYQTNYMLAQAYFDEVTAPDKKLYLMENMTHGLLESRSEDFSKIIHEIAQMRQQ